MIQRPAKGAGFRHNRHSLRRAPRFARATTSRRLHDRLRRSGHPQLREGGRAQCRVGRVGRPLGAQKSEPAGRSRSGDRSGDSGDRRGDSSDRCPYPVSRRFTAQSGVQVVHGLSTSTPVAWLGTKPTSERSATSSGRWNERAERLQRLLGAPSAWNPGGGEDRVLASAPGGRSYVDRHAAVEGLQPAC